jgi:cellulose synthase/poly-beta-1,6-N-acetylglucosamine synthase-like glycosyltransferase
VLRLGVSARCEADQRRHGYVQVSVVVPAYKAEGFIVETVSSISRQMLQNLEIVVVDDASPDRTASIVAAFSMNDPRVRLTAKSRNEGVCLARNDATAVAGSLLSTPMTGAWRPSGGGAATGSPRRRSFEGVWA